LSANSLGINKNKQFIFKKIYFLIKKRKMFQPMGSSSGVNVKEDGDKTFRIFIPTKEIPSLKVSRFTITNCQIQKRRFN